MFASKIGKKYQKKEGIRERRKTNGKIVFICTGYALAVQKAHCFLLQLMLKKCYSVWMNVRIFLLKTKVNCNRFGMQRSLLFMVFSHLVSHVMSMCVRDFMAIFNVIDQMQTSCFKQTIEKKTLLVFDHVLWRELRMWGGKCVTMKKKQEQMQSFLIKFTVVVFVVNGNGVKMYQMQNSFYFYYNLSMVKQTGHVYVIINCKIGKEKYSYKCIHNALITWVELKMYVSIYPIIYCNFHF